MLCSVKRAKAKAALKVGFQHACSSSLLRTNAHARRASKHHNKQQLLHRDARIASFGYGLRIVRIYARHSSPQGWLLTLRSPASVHRAVLRHGPRVRQGLLE
jgi:broad specificity phosphatase PhoE